MDKNLKYINAINILVNAKPGALQAIHGAFGGDWAGAWKNDLTKYITRDKDAESTLVAIDYEKPKREINPDKEWAKLEKEKIQIITLLDKNYPGPLRHIHNPPFLLYVRGAIDALDQTCLGVVGTRVLSEYGKRSTPHIVLNIARAGFTIVSGLANGIDTIAHKAALEAGAKTIAILGTGIDDRTIYPAANLRLAHKIIETGGAVISEYALGTHGTKFSFPQRNRIISGLSKGVLVVEADEQSGALITAAYALEQNRDVFAIPGSIFAKTSRGPNNLIKKGAKAVTCAEDILEEYNIKFLTSNLRQKIKPDNLTEEKILAAFAGNPVTADDIIRQTGLSAPEVVVSLTTMELKRKIRNLNGKFILY